MNQQRVGEIHAPVLLTIGAEDKIWTQDGWAQEKDRFTGSGDASAESVPNAGHYPMFERAVPELRRIVATWPSGPRFGGT
jgi:pimeloyl-ACP methyl ester carboxylesterase